MYPPFSWMVRLELTGLEKERVQLRAMNLAKDLQGKTKLFEIFISILFILCIFALLILIILSVN